MGYASEEPIPRDMSPFELALRFGVGVPHFVALIYFVLNHNGLWALLCGASFFACIIAIDYAFSANREKVSPEDSSLSDH